MDWITIVVTAGVGAVASIATSYVTTHLTARHQLRRWRTDMVEKYANLAVEHPAKAQAFARQFAIGVLVIEHLGSNQRDKVFVSPHVRMVAGRHPNNEIVLSTPGAGRCHFAISADNSRVYVEDLGSANGTFLNDKLVSGRTALQAGDLLQVDDFCRIEFQRLASNV